MADISDVEQAIADFVTSILYPSGSSRSSITGTLCRIYRGWPNSATLNADLSAQTVNVTIGSDNTPGKTTTRYLPRWQTTLTQPGATVAINGQAIAISGSPSPGDVVGVIVDGRPYSYRVQSGDTPGLVASSLGVMIQADRIASVAGAQITLPGARALIARVVCDSAASFESRRQEKEVRIICWCPTPSVRDVTAAAVDAGFAQIEFLPLRDNALARVLYHNTASYDQAQNALLYRRDLIYSVEYPTITTVRLPSMIFGSSDLNNNITYG